ncbi:hypothetical protein CONPUDRAFT_154005 [Coniophora puteana RWD-64-598 SS2]|uniref:Uncharacterized protein n=1 Tax=Coniophora puteana (strain RWD-64-598) TaxID=741705 RepID=A0A5M3MSF2_CONPW|nr:uncharacterized protein CONPUDRAFT_154005 [Coniophora puteana RWD-64-598 SS2]EIW81461.1 hypothetical protein CONPUDRAFT_154005 [Coniophora puteana RWD-64-598 SS2]
MSPSTFIYVSEEEKQDTATAGKAIAAIAILALVIILVLYFARVFTGRPSILCRLPATSDACLSFLHTQSSVELHTEGPKPGLTLAARSFPLVAAPGAVVHAPRCAATVPPYGLDLCDPKLSPDYGAEVARSASIGSPSGSTTFRSSGGSDVALSPISMAATPVQYPANVYHAATSRAV